MKSLLFSDADLAVGTKLVPVDWSGCATGDRFVFTIESVTEEGDQYRLRTTCNNGPNEGRSVWHNLSADPVGVGDVPQKELDAMYEKSRKGNAEAKKQVAIHKLKETTMGLLSGWFAGTLSSKTPWSPSQLVGKSFSAAYLRQDNGYPGWRKLQVLADLPF